VTAQTATQPLNRQTYRAGTLAPIRIIHIGLGAFHRAHQAWYTHKVDANHEWGIASFTGRSPQAAETLEAQDGLYTLVERAEDADTFEVIESISAAYDGGNIGRLAELLSQSTTAIVTLTVTEAAYYLGSDGQLDLAAEPVAADAALLGQWWKASAALVGSSGSGRRGVPSTAAARLLIGLDARRKADAGPITVVSCDNLSANGTAARNAVHGLASAIAPELAGWIDENVSFVDTSIDRITPRTTDEDVAGVVAATGFADRSPVVTEPFHSWVLCGDFPAGRPPWEDAGAVFVDRIEHFERRKLWLLNGAHSLLAYAGQLRGSDTVAQALHDPVCAVWIEEFWDEAAEHLTDPELKVDEYRAALLARFGNSRIAHMLAQIAIDGSSKLRMRAVPVIRAERAAGRTGQAAARLIAAWVEYLAKVSNDGAGVRDAEAERITPLLTLDGLELTAALVELLDSNFAAEDGVVEMVHALRGSFQDQ
jgi:fructuronate reductase